MVRIYRGFIILILLVFLINLIPYSALSDNSPPVLSRANVTPRKSYPNIDYLFTVTYTDSDNDAPASISVNIDGVDYEMEEVDLQDSNFTDGKDYSYKKVMAEGSYSFYYEANDGNGSEVATNSQTLSVTWDVGHYDIIHFIEEDVFPGLFMLLAVVFIILIVLCVITFLMVLQLRRIAKELEGKKEGENENTGKDINSQTQ